MAEVADIPATMAHFARHGDESGRGGDLVFSPMTDGNSWRDLAYGEKARVKWERNLSEPGWERVWLLENGFQICGHVVLFGSGLPASLHRCTLAIGLEREARSQGWGRALMEECLRWCQSQAPLEWVDLYVFSHNNPARALYKSLGFQEIGTTEDLFRVHGKKIADVHMVKRVK